MRIFDNHVHLRSSSIDFFLNAFKKAGGTSINLVNLTEDCFSLEEFKRRYEETINISRILREKGLEVVVTIGPYPVNIITMKERMEIGETVEIYRNAVDAAIRLIEEQRANAIGEVGRPHFDTSDEIKEGSKVIMEYIFQSTAERDIPVILHTESLDARGMCDIMEMAKKNGKRSLIVKHFSQPIFSNNCGIVPSVPSGRKNARAAPWGEKGFFLETDFAGDESNPNFVLPPDSVPRRVAMLIQEGMEEEKISKSMDYFLDFYKM